MNWNILASLRHQLFPDSSSTGTSSLPSTMMSSSSSVKEKGGKTEITGEDELELMQSALKEEVKDRTPSVGGALSNLTPADAQIKGNETDKSEEEDSKADLNGQREGTTIPTSVSKVADPDAASKTPSMKDPTVVVAPKSLDTASRFSATFMKCYQLGNSGYITPILEHWLFFASFILLTPEIRATATREQMVDENLFPAVLGTYIPASSKKGLAKKDFLDHMGFFWDICLDSNLPFTLHYEKTHIHLLAKQNADASTLINSVTGIAIPLTAPLFKQMSKHAMYRILGVLVPEKKDHFLVIGPIAFVAHYCSAKIAPLLGFKKFKDMVYNSTVSPKSLPVSARGYVLQLSEPVPAENLEVAGTNRRLVLRFPDSDWHNTSNGFGRHFVCRCSTCVKQINGESTEGLKKLISIYKPSSLQFISHVCNIYRPKTPSRGVTKSVQMLVRCYRM